MNLSPIQQTKANLYKLLLEKDITTLTDVEIELMYQLAKDEEIQAILNDKRWVAETQ